MTCTVFFKQQYVCNDFLNDYQGAVVSYNMSDLVFIRLIKNIVALCKLVRVVYSWCINRVKVSGTISPISKVYREGKNI